MKSLNFLLFPLILFACKGQEVAETQKVQKEQYLRWVDDIAYDASQDDSTFTLCDAEHRVIQYFNDTKGLLYQGGKPAIDSAFAQNYRSKSSWDDNGLVRIRFIINCTGKTDRFRLLAMDYNYQPIEFPTRVTDQLMEITQNLDGWKTKSLKDTPVDYYQYLIFKIQNGKIINILP